MIKKQIKINSKNHDWEDLTKDKLILTIPVNQQGNLRPISSVNQINKAISILKGKPKIRRTMWSRRAQEYDQKINSGKS